jgi:hypothetical protein
MRLTKGSVLVRVRQISEVAQLRGDTQSNNA